MLTASNVVLKNESSGAARLQMYIHTLLNLSTETCLEYGIPNKMSITCYQC